LLERALELLVDRGPHLFEPLLGLLLDLAEPEIDRAAHHVDALLDRLTHGAQASAHLLSQVVGLAGQLTPALRELLAENALPSLLRLRQGLEPRGECRGALTRRPRTSRDRKRRQRHGGHEQHPQGQAAGHEPGIHARPPSAPPSSPDPI
jgi:hypothetical protein